MLDPAQEKPIICKSNHPISEDNLVLIQPSNPREMSITEYLANLKPQEKELITAFIKAAGSYWQDYKLGLIAVGTKTFPESYWQDVARLAQRGNADYYQKIIDNRGQDIDFRLLCSDQSNLEVLKSVPAIIPSWSQLLQTQLLTDRAINCSNSYEFEHGAVLLSRTIEAMLDSNGNVTGQRIDNRPWRYKVKATGYCLNITADSSTPIHIKSNLANTAEKIIDAERQMGFCFTELFTNGQVAEFLGLLGAN